MFSHLGFGDVIISTLPGSGVRIHNQPEQKGCIIKFAHHYDPNERAMDKQVTILEVTDQLIKIRVYSCSPNLCGSGVVPLGITLEITLQGQMQLTEAGYR